MKRGVYFIYAPNQSKIKIGRSKHIEIRFKQLRTGFMDQGLLLFGIITENEIDLEREIHNNFTHLRSNGEWFFLTKELRDYINKIQRQSNIEYYNDISEIERKLTYSSLGIFKAVIYLKNVGNNYVIPISLIILGFLFAFNYYKLNKQADNEILVYFSYALMIIYPLYTPILGRYVIKYCSVKESIIFLTLLIVGFLIEASTFIIDLNHRTINILRILYVSLTYPFTNQLLLFIWNKKYEETLEKEAINKYQNLNQKEIIKAYEKLKSNKHKLNQITIKSFIICYIGFFITINVYVIISNHQIIQKFFLLSIFDIGVLCWLFFDFFYKKRTSIGTKIKSLSLFLFFILSNSIDQELFGMLISIFGVFFAPVSIIFLITTLKEKNINAEIMEIKEIFNT